MIPREGVERFICQNLQKRPDCFFRVIPREGVESQLSEGDVGVLKDPRLVIPREGVESTARFSEARSFSTVRDPERGS